MFLRGVRRSGEVELFIMRSGEFYITTRGTPFGTPTVNTPNEMIQIGEAFDADNVGECGGKGLIYNSLVGSCPLFVGGKLAVFISPGDDIPFGCLGQLGDRSTGGDIYLSTALKADLRAGRFHQPTSLESIMDLNPDVIAISYLDSEQSITAMKVGIVLFKVCSQYYPTQYHLLNSAL
jgi:hypothetical protein